jgi:hypothetical protein
MDTGPPLPFALVAVLNEGSRGESAKGNVPSGGKSNMAGKSPQNGGFIWDNYL